MKYYTVKWGKPIRHTYKIKELLDYSTGEEADWSLKPEPASVYYTISGRTNENSN